MAFVPLPLLLRVVCALRVAVRFVRIVHKRSRPQ